MDSPAQPNGKHDVWTYRIAVACLGATVLLTAGAITALSALGSDIPPALPALGGTALGALTGMLSAIFQRSH